jgi:hypothetical protein
LADEAAHRSMMYLLAPRAASTFEELEDDDELITSTANVYPSVLLRLAIVSGTRIEAVRAQFRNASAAPLAMELRWPSRSSGFTELPQADCERAQRDLVLALPATVVQQQVFRELASIRPELAGEGLSPNARNRTHGAASLRSLSRHCGRVSFRLDVQRV